ncbi:MAG: UDP binding domain-containing protein [Halobacteriota archaeon]
MGNGYWIAHYRSHITNHRLRITDHTLPIADRDTRESPVREMVKELKEFGVEAYGYDPLLSKEEIEGFGVKALDNLDVEIKMDGVIVAVAHDEF